MRIKRIDLVGFKSFCDKTALDLEQPVTAVVGPNGCGKSNLVDALRWAMGEQSARHLRGQSMEDVIFNGSDSRGPSGMAEITVTFANDGRLAPEYASHGEISVTRRLHRDGTSEYLINKLPARLRDITELFLGTGVGTKAYSIVEQGRVGLIVSAKPEDRRLFIEEVAGITKYRRSRNLAERKMEATRQNLLRVSDVADEISRRLGSLHRQAQKAERYRKYKTELREIDLWQASHQLLAFLVEKNYLESVHHSVTEELAAASEKLAEHEVHLERERAGVSAEEHELTLLQEQLYLLENQIQLGESELEFEKKEALQLRQRADQSQGEIEQLANQYEDAKTREELVRNGHEELSQRIGALGLERQVREEVLAGLRGELASLDAGIERERNVVIRAEQQKTKAAADSEALVTRRSETDRQKSRVEEELAEALGRIHELAGEVGAAEEDLGTLRRENELRSTKQGELGEQLSELDKKIARGEAEIEVLREELYRRRSRLASLQEIQTRYEGFGSGTRAVMQRHNGSSREEGVLGIVGETLEVSPAYEVALEAVLGHRLGTVIVENHDIGVDQIRFLKDQSHGRSSFIARAGKTTTNLSEAPVGYSWQPDQAEAMTGAELVLTAATANACAWPGQVSTEQSMLRSMHGPMLTMIECPQEYRSVAESLLEGVYVVENLDAALTIWGEMPDATLVTLEGEILERDGTISGGSHHSETAGFLRQKREINELSEIIEEMKTQYDAALERQLSLKTERSTIRQQFGSTAQELHDGEKAALSREKDLGRSLADHETLSVRQARLTEERDRLEALLCEMIRLREQLVVDIDQAEETLVRGKEALDALSADRTRAATLYEDAEQGTMDVRIQLAELEATARASADQARQLAEQLADIERRTERLQRDSRAGLDRAAELEGRAEGRIGALAELRAQQDERKGALEAQKSTFAERRHQLDLDEVLAKELRTAAYNATGKANTLQLRLSELEMECRHVVDRVWERHHEDLRRVAGDYHLLPQMGQEQEQRQEQLRSLIERMGEINLTAIDEFHELSERHTFISTQREDLQSALDQLQRAIQKINRTCRTRFLETFELVNERFQQVFPRLFQGGRARLALTESDDPLMSGVEIIAQPPGKKLASIESMSGGEKALTATSMIFAMFLVKPTPFCVLDEVDAPLDEANVVRFRQLVKEMSAQSQFIIITHSRSTMESADRLYGVTMEEAGVSRLVSLNLTEALEAAA